MKLPRHVLFIFLLFIQFTLCFSKITGDNNNAPNGVLKSMGNSLSSILHNNIKNIKDSFLKNTTNVTKHITDFNDDISKNINSIFKKSPAEELHAIDKYSKDQFNKLKENPENKLFFSKLFNFNSKSENNTNKATEISQENTNEEKKGFWNFIQNINKSNDNIKDKLEKEKNENKNENENESKWFKFLFPSNVSKNKETEKVENNNNNNNANTVTNKEKDNENGSYFFFRKKNDNKETESKEVATKTNNNAKKKWAIFDAFFHTENVNEDKVEKEEKEEREDHDIEVNENAKKEKKFSFFPFWKSKSDENCEKNCEKNSSIPNKVDNNQNTNLDLKNKDDNKNLMNLVRHYYEDTENLSDENLLSLLNTEHKADAQVNNYPLAEFKICLNNCHKSLEKNIDENDDKKIIKNLSHSDYKSLEKCISQCKNVNLDNIGFKNGEVLNVKENNKIFENLKNDNTNLNTDIAPAFSDFVALEKYSDNNEKEENINMKNISTELKNNNFLNMEFVKDIDNGKNQNEIDNANAKNLSTTLYNTNIQNNAINNLQEKTLDVLNRLANKNDGTELNNMKENTQFDENGEIKTQSNINENNENDKKHGYISTSFFLFMVLVTFFIYLSAFTNIINQFYVAFKEKVILYIKQKYKNQLDQINRESSQPFIPKPFNQNYSESASYDSIYNPLQNAYEIS
ncbi:conserved Plasmodium protein, unknown function [Plasmodium chabaudi chabaudi]|uniref:EMP1-trafficking protein n=1 Tax=Plasmodium chabaudi chabaudi TaxID=31271 RepID=A0A4V0KCP6_PLACU|nr:conserved Plasmodium protein, unknown function [Plasmodium chabaudi chabaudi]VTZ71136.1 conserved Plasmodium protein, unknown function [Plasmodium chabaudi chabaudi]|eukprot:XP_745925.2 conserved Plasmodium protein, unknown function [Plasmodium chabaudi chabaudi]